MIKRTLYFGNKAYLSLKNRQISITAVDETGKEIAATRPIEDIGVVVIDSPMVTFTSGLMEALLENNCSVITCDKAHMPVGLMLPLCGNSTQNERFRNQLDASLPLKKQLWQQTVSRKIANQAAVLAARGIENRNMLAWSNDVRSGDSENLEGRAAAYYWRNLFGEDYGFTRDRDGVPPNSLLNYGYAILRAVVARALVSSGMLPTLGIHHHNRYNAYCLADDIMEPYRPYVDEVVLRLIDDNHNGILDKEAKTALLSVPIIEVEINGRRRPLMVGVSETTSSLYKCFAGELRKISYPVK